MAEKSKLKRALVNQNWDEAIMQKIAREREKKEKYERGVETPRLQSEKDEHLTRGQDYRE